ncbi:hypothetical protein LWE61_08035 [Sphingobium sufflavum]|uniref:hypothetical protein n=1 Tax=Sphingobium sufflavum TaxID=1129547 RepID=UPI001F3A2EC6|nr:hypothetical protein [Sphingobium sufflavum]MCE7796510.1 hypothetical protein [Sphingobium sufflavum]
MTAHYSPRYGERLSRQKETALLHAFDGLLVVGDAVVSTFEARGRTDQLEALGLHSAVTPPERERRRLTRASGRDRLCWPGLRDDLHRDHKVVTDLLGALRAAPDAVPTPDPVIVKRLWLMKGFAQEDNIITLHGVPVPAGEEQLRYFIVLRYRPLFSPLADPIRIYRGDADYDRANTTDAVQARIILVSTRSYLDSLIWLQRDFFDLFAAIWLRQIDRADMFIRQIPHKDLPPCYARSRIKNRAICLRISCGVMNEYERGFDLLFGLRDEIGVSRQSVRDTLTSCSSMTAVHNGTDPTHRYIAGAAGHIRVLHPTMNRVSPTLHVDTVFAQMKSGFDHSALHAGRFRRIRSATSDIPARLFCGVEPAMLLAVMLIQMVETMVAHEGRFWTREVQKNIDREYRDPDRRSRDVMSLATIMTGAICLPSARALMHHGANDGSLSDDEWVLAMARQLLPAQEPDRNDDSDPDDISWRMETGASAVKEVEETDEDFGDRFKNIYAEARKRARHCTSRPGRPGWTQGFHFDAWWQPDAEIGFLRQACRFIGYDAKLAAKARRWNRAVSHVPHGSGRPMTSPDCYTGLPTQQPVERVQDFFRPYFDLLQVPDLVRDADLRASALYHEALIHEIARLLPALSPITDDPYRYEMLWLEEDMKVLEKKNPDEHRNALQAQALAVEGAWNS